MANTLHHTLFVEPVKLLQPSLKQLLNDAQNYRSSSPSLSLASIDFYIVPLNKLFTSSTDIGLGYLGELITTRHKTRAASHETRATTSI